MLHPFIRILSENKIYLRLRELSPDRFERINRIRVAFPFYFKVRHLQTWELSDSKADHCKTMFYGSARTEISFMGRPCGRDEKHLIELELFQRVAGQSQMAAVYRIECPP